MRLFSIFAIAILVSSCGPSSELDRARSQARSLNAQIKADAGKIAQDVQIGAQTFRVSVVKDGFYRAVAKDDTGTEFDLKRRTDQHVAFVDRVGPSGISYRAADVEAAARKVTGCKAILEPGILAAIGGFNANTDLSYIEEKAPKLGAWTTSLKC